MENHFDENIDKQSYLIRDLRIYINECHETCLTCDGDKIDDCLSCHNDNDSYYDLNSKRCIGLNG